MNPDLDVLQFFVKFTKTGACRRSLLTLSVLSHEQMLTIRHAGVGIESLVLDDGTKRFRN